MDIAAARPKTEHRHNSCVIKNQAKYFLRHAGKTLTIRHYSCNLRDMKVPRETWPERKEKTRAAIGFCQDFDPYTDTEKEQPMIDFKVTREDALLIDRITNRALRLAAQPLAYDKTSLSMDLTACHANGNPLKLAELLAADDFNFSHDVFGIRHHIDRKTGTLRDCFVPRFSTPKAP